MTLVLRQNADEDIPGRYADDKRRKSSPPNRVGHQSPIAQPGTQCQIEFPLIQLMAFGCTVVSTVIRLRSLLRNAPAWCATLKLSANNSSSLSPSRLHQWLRSERSCGNAC